MSHAPAVSIARAVVPIVAWLLACSPETAPTRPGPVGRLTREYSDHSRPRWDGEGPRPLVTTVWYPALLDAHEALWKVGGPPGLPAFRAGWSAEGAALDPAGAPYPLVLLSHGTGGAAAQLAWLADALAAHGYVVAAVNHHGNTALEEAYLPQGFVLWWERAEDLRRALDQLLDDPVLGPAVDPARVGAAGFSLGGYTVLAVAGAVVSVERIQAYCAGPERTETSCELPPEAAAFSLDEVLRLAETDADVQASLARHGESYRDQRVRAVLAIAPGLGPALVPESLAAIRIPVEIVVGAADPETPPEESALPIAAAIPGAELRVLPDVAHYTFLAECTPFGGILLRDLCSDPVGVSRREVHERVAADALAFFVATLGRSR